MAKTTTTSLIPPVRPTEASTNYECPTVSDNDDYPSLSDLLKSILLANTYSEP